MDTFKKSNKKFQYLAREVIDKHIMVGVRMRKNFLFLFMALKF